MAFQLPARVEQNIGQFVGRTWLLPEVTHWFQETSERLLILVGDPGTGKSMIAAWLAGEGPTPKDAEAQKQLAQISDHVKGAHFCVFEGGGADPVDMARNLASQLVARVDGFGDALADSLADLVNIEGVAKADTVMQDATLTGVRIGYLKLEGIPAQHSFNRAVRWPLQQVYRNGYKESMLIIVDALDEALPFSKTDSIVHLLGKLTDLPEQVRFLATSRPDERVFYLLPRAKLFYLDQDAPPDQKPGQDDVYHYAVEQLEKLAPELKEEQRKALAVRISHAADRVFLYAHLLLDDLEQGVRKLADLETAELPQGLPGLYHEFLNRELGANRKIWRKVYRPVLGLIAVARGEGLNATQLEKLTGKDVDVEEALEVCKQYLEGELPEGPFRPFHRSFADFLLEAPGNKAFHVDDTRMHNTIAQYYWKTYRSSWHSCDAYGLDNLAAHLFAGGDTDRLQALINRGWMSARYSGSGDMYSGFLADVDLAWRAAEQIDEQDVALGQFASRLGSEVWCAVCEATVRSLSASIAPEILVAAVDKQIWPVEQALAWARQMPDPKRRVAALSGLSAHLSEPLQSEVLGEALAAAKTITNEHARAETLIGLADSLPDSLLPQLYEAVRMIGGPGQCVRNLAQLAPHLPAPFRDRAVGQAVDLIPTIQPSQHRIGALESLAPRLSEPLLRKALNAARELADGKTRMEALSKLIPFLPQPLRSEVLEETQMAAQEVVDEQAQSYALKNLVELASQVGCLAEGLGAARMMTSEVDRVSALKELIPHLSKTLLAQAESEAQQLGAPQQGAVLAAVYRRLAELGHPEEAFAAAMAFPRDSHLPQPAIRHIASLLPGPAVQQALAEALGRYGHAWSAVAPLVARLAQLGYAEEALAAVGQIESAHGRAVALRSLAPHLPGPLFGRAVASAREIGRLDSRTWALSALATAGPEPQREDLLCEILDSVQAISKAEDRADALGSVVHDVAPHLIGVPLSRALDAALLLGQDPWGVKYHRTRILSSLAPRLAAVGRTEDSLVACRAIADRKDRARALCGLIQYLPEPLCDDVRQEVLETARVGEDNSIPADLLADLALSWSDLNPAEREATVAARSKEQKDRHSRISRDLVLAARLGLASEALTTALASDDAGHVAALWPHLPASLLEEALAAMRGLGRRSETALAQIAPSLPPPLLRNLLEVGNVKNVEVEALVLARLALQLEEPLRSQALDRVLDYVRRFRGEKPAGVLTVLSPQLPEPMLRDALDLAQAMESKTHRAWALVGLLPSGMSDDWQEVLWAAWKIKDAGGLEEHLAGLTPRLAELGHPEEAVAAARTIEEGRFQAWALVRMAPHLPDSLQQQVLVEAMAARLQGEEWTWLLSAVASRIPEAVLLETVRVAAAITNDKARADSLSGLLPQMATLGHVEEAVAFVRACADEKARTKLWASLAPHLPSSALKEALADAANMDEGLLQREVLPGLLERQAALGQPDEALRCALAVSDRQTQSEVVVALVPHLPLRLKEQVMQELLLPLKTAQRVSWWWLAAIARASAGLNDPLKRKVLDAVMQAARAIPEGHERAAVLAQVAAGLPEPLKGQALRDGLTAALAADRWGPGPRRAPVLSELGRQLGTLPTARLYPIWQEALHTIAGRVRSEMLVELQSLVPVIRALGGPGAIGDTAEVLLDVSTW
jgi:hypothetical protein